MINQLSLIFLVYIMCHSNIFSQDIHFIKRENGWRYIEEQNLNTCDTIRKLQLPGPGFLFRWKDIASSPNNKTILLENRGVYIIDTLEQELNYIDTIYQATQDLVSNFTGEKIYFSSSFDSILVFDMIDNNWTKVFGHDGYGRLSSISMRNGHIIFGWAPTSGAGNVNNIKMVNPHNPATERVIMDLPDSLNYGLLGLVAVGANCDSVKYYIKARIYPSNNQYIYKVNFISKTLELICESDDTHVGYTHPTEHHSSECFFEIDHDGDNSVTAVDWRYNTGVHCPSDSIHLTDSDPFINSYRSVDSIRFFIYGETEPDSPPDGDTEILEFKNQIGGFNLFQRSPNTYTLAPDNQAIIADFEDALSQVVYRNTAQQPTPGRRKIALLLFGGPRQSDSTWVHLELLPQASFTLGKDTSMCPGENLVLEPDTLYDQLIWSDATTQEQLEISEPGWYWLEQSASGICQYRDSVRIDLIPKTAVSLGPDMRICQGDTLLLDAGVHDEIEWSTGEANQFLPIDSTGVYWVVARDEGLCANIDTINITEGEPIPVQFDILDPSCTGRADGQVIPQTTIEYDLVLEGQKLPTDTINNLSAGVYEVVVLPGTKQYCEDQFTIELVDPDPTFFDITQNEYIATPGSIIEIDWNSNISVIDSLVLIPSEGLQSYSNESLLIQTDNEQGYDVVVFDENGCESGDSFIIRLLSTQLYVPNVFSPNGDGVNDLFSPLGGEDIKHVSMRIYDRWGNEVYHNPMLPTDGSMGWDGTFRNQQAQSGVYSYVIQYQLPDGQTFNFQGDITLLR